jgi:hypothetical protein
VLPVAPELGPTGATAIAVAGRDERRTAQTQAPMSIDLRAPCAIALRSAILTSTRLVSVPRA